MRKVFCDECGDELFTTRECASTGEALQVPLRRKGEGGVFAHVTIRVNPSGDTDVCWRCVIKILQATDDNA